MFAIARNCPQLLSGLKFDVLKLSIRLKSIPIPTRTTSYIQCRVGYVTMDKSIDSTSNTIQQKETTQEAFNEKLIQKVTEIREEIDKTQSRFTQELHRFTIDLSKLIEK